MANTSIETVNAFDKLTAAINASKPVLSLAPTEKAMASRSNWKGVLTGFGPLEIGVQTFKATEEEKVSFNTIHLCNADKIAEAAKAEAEGKKVDKVTPIYNQLKQGKMFCPCCNVTVEKNDQLKGYQYAENSFVTVSDEELKSLAVESDKKMHITSFAPADTIDSIYFSNTEYIAPEKGSNPYFNLLRSAMVAQGVYAIASSNQKGREQTLVIRPYGTNGMAIHYLYFDNEVRGMDKWETVEVEESLIEVAGDVIKTMIEPFNPSEYQDTSIRAKKGLINDKIEGKAITIKPEPTAPVATSSKVDVMALLKSSLENPQPKKLKTMAATA